MHTFYIHRDVLLFHSFSFIHFFSLFLFPPFHLICTSSDRESSLSLRKIIVTINQLCCSHLETIIDATSFITCNRAIYVRRWCMTFCVETARINFEYSLSCIMLSLKNNHTDACACPFVIRPSNIPFTLVKTIASMLCGYTNYQYEIYSFWNSYAVCDMFA